VALLTNVLEKIPWVNAPYFKRRYPERFEAAKIYFLPTVVIDPKHQDLRRIGAKGRRHSSLSGRVVSWPSTTRRRSARASRHSSAAAWASRSRKRILDRLVYQIFYYDDPG